MAKILEKNDPQYLLGFWNEVHLINDKKARVTKDIAIAEFQSVEDDIKNIIKQMEIKNISIAELYQVTSNGREHSKKLIETYIIPSSAWHAG